ncbi:ribosomal protein S6 kinase alpha-6-like [Archocentrus centrarchus]|uniref:ribosomal protein S6 kinase alpha-6-like n=1 Tax=Archocentrus centrarchus TaxID=63155 RepID=UPI0011EA2187|nr:ribosomal protein S6 kinase alpha-6-like [Archocentrus centrarchus]
MLHLDCNQRITPLEALRHPFFDSSLSQNSSRDACIDMQNKEDQSLVPKPGCQSKSPHSIDCGVQNPVKLPEQTPLNMSVKKPYVLPNDLEIAEGTMLGNSYKVENFLGEGSFGYVTKCLNTQTNKAVAIKVNRNDPESLERAKLEMFILEQLRCLDPDRCNIVKWNGFFLDRERICLNFELLDQSLFDYMKDRNNQGLPISELRPILYQLTNALSHLSSMGIAHTDLKPDNVMVVDRHQSPIKVKIIDFGLARPVSSLNPCDNLQTAWYMAPEVMVSAPFNQAIDMWSLGLIAAELAIGQPVYPGETEFDVLRFIICTQGQPPDCVLDRGFDTERYFIQENCGNRHWRFKSVQEFQHDEGYQMQETRYFKLKSLDDLEKLMKKRTGHHSGQDLLVSLIKQMLHLDCNQRITPMEALRHPFFDTGPSQSSSRNTCIDMQNKEDPSLVLFQQPSYCQSKTPHSIVKNPVELLEQTPLNTTFNKPSVLPNDLDIVEGTILGNSYKVEALLGEGCFGQVAKCVNIQTNKAVAIKVTWEDSESLEQATMEMLILEKLRCLDPDRCNIVKWNGFFLDRGRICLNFELLDQSLYDYMKDRNNQGLPISELRPILYQLTNALSHLSSMNIVHTDLKPDNVMVVDRHQSPIKVKLIDFGLACSVSSLDPTLCVQPIWRRAPEVMVSAPFNQAIDMWSLGTIAVDMATGWPLYPGETEFDVLRLIILTQGQPPDCVLDHGFDTGRYFIRENCGSRHWRFKSEQEFKLDKGHQMLEPQFFKLKSLDDLEKLMKKRTGHHSGQDLLVSLIKQMLHLDYNQRITPMEALRHPFFDPSPSQNSSRDACIDMQNKEDQSLVLFQQPSYSQSKSAHKIVKNPVELPEQTPLNMTFNKPSVPPNDLDIVEGTILGNSYKVEALLGAGSFGHVAKCVNIQTNKAVAIKVNKNRLKSLKQAKSEMFILEQLRCLDPDRCNIVKWNGYFLDRERICLNFELLDQSLLHYLKDRRNEGLPISELRPILYQLTNALSHLSSMGIVHTDLKPDNVMVVDRHQSPIKVKLIDFGLARPVSSLDPIVRVQPIWRRAPEVMVSAPFNQAIDMWSLGTIAVDMAIGWALYPGETEFDVLRLIILTQGQPPDCVLDHGFDTERYFIQENCGNRHWRFKSKQEIKRDEGYRLQETRYFKLKSLDDLEKLMKKRTGHHSGQDLLVSLIKQMLHLDCNQRITPLEALRHPFFDPSPS